MPRDISVYGRLAIAPIQFPEEVELRVHAKDRKTSEPLGWFITVFPHRTWQWVCERFRLTDEEIAEAAGHLEAGAAWGIRDGIFNTPLDDGQVLPDGYERAVHY